MRAGRRFFLLKCGPARIRAADLTDHRRRGGFPTEKLGSAVRFRDLAQLALQEKENSRDQGIVTPRDRASLLYSIPSLET